MHLTIYTICATAAPQHCVMSGQTLAFSKNGSLSDSGSFWWILDWWTQGFLDNFSSLKLPPQQTPMLSLIQLSVVQWPNWTDCLWCHIFLLRFWKKPCNHSYGTRSKLDSSHVLSKKAESSCAAVCGVWLNGFFEGWIYPIAFVKSTVGAVSRCEFSANKDSRI